MECSEIRELLSPMTDREVSSDDLSAVEEHLSSCRDCAFESTMILGLKRLLGSWEGIHASETFRTKVLERVHKAPSRPSLPEVPWRTIAAVGAILAGVGALAAAVVIILPLIARSPAPADPGPEGPPPGGPGTGERGGRPPRGFPAGGADRGVGPATPARHPGVPGGVPRPVGPGGTPVPAGGLARAGGGAALAQLRLQEGAVYIEHPGSFPSLGSPGDELRPGQSVKTSKKGTAELLFAAGFLARLEPGSDLAFSKDAPAPGAGAGGFDAELRAGTVFLAGPDEPGRRVAPSTVRYGRTVLVLDRGDLLVALRRGEDGALRVVVGGGEAEVRLANGSQKLREGEILVAGRDGLLRDPPRAADAAELEKLRSWGKQ